MIMIEQNRTIAATPTKVAFGTNVTVSWSVPKDEATHQDWIGVYPKGADNSKYIDFRSVLMAMSSNRTTIQNKEQGSYCFTMEIKCQINSCLALYSVLSSCLRR